MSSYHNERPIYFTEEVTLGGVQCFLDIDQKNKIKGYYFIGQDPQTIETFSCFAKEVENLDLQDALQMDRFDSKLFYLPAWSLRLMARKILGVPPTNVELTGHSEEDLICRCFGVYGKQIEEIVKTKPDCKEREITDQTMAGGGCSSCLEDIQTLMLRVRSELNIEPETEVRIPADFDPEKAKKALAVFLKLSFPGLEIIELIVDRQKITVVTDNISLERRADLLDKIEKMMEQNFGVALDILLQTP